MTGNGGQEPEKRRGMKRGEELEGQKDWNRRQLKRGVGVGSQKERERD